MVLMDGKTYLGSAELIGKAFPSLPGAAGEGKGEGEGLPGAAGEGEGEGEGEGLPGAAGEGEGEGLPGAAGEGEGEGEGLSGAEGEDEVLPGGEGLPRDDGEGARSVEGLPGAAGEGEGEGEGEGLPGAVGEGLPGGESLPRDVGECLPRDDSEGARRRRGDNSEVLYFIILHYILSFTDKYRKPERRCTFCKIGQMQLSRHISQQHQDIPEVSEAMKFPQNSKERNTIFENFRKRGIYEFNKKHQSANLLMLGSFGDEEDAKEFIGRNEYVTLRDAVCCRITLFNARRGGEPSRLKVTNLDDAVAKRWIDDSRMEQLETREKKLFSEIMVACQAGKGNHLVPVLGPLAQNDLSHRHKDKRKEVGILDENCYVFPNTQQSAYHVLGWHAIRSMCGAAGVKHPELLIASKQRHRISTIYASLEVPTTEREYFYKHMGHSKGVNEGVYQYPLPIQEVIKVGKHLHIDQGDAPLATESMIQSQPDMGAIADQQEEDAHDVNTTQPNTTQALSKIKIKAIYIALYVHTTQACPECTQIAGMQFAL
ncbi:uncharacterized protein LOC125372177 [Haliotis rufescens]|uniref:uncharacterized protein LOC125372177 n=1 Tax=Haliotis rufescens TaxID=6454 RepID=UPI00201F3A8A|nr:uncharacterized protein LOC125372177 [Haliotis rufescens]